MNTCGLKFYLRRVCLPLDLGAIQPLYYFESADGEHMGHVRANNRLHAKDKVRQKFPYARFWG